MNKQNNKKHKVYEWVVVGGGIAGLAIAEILTRQGHSVLLLEKGPKLGGGTTGEFHEWIHTGALYTLLPRLVTMKYTLGAIDDLLDYYSAFPRMNLIPTNCGLSINKPGWFESNYIHFRYRKRAFNPIWMLIIARSQHLIKRIAMHDWLRRRAGIIEEYREDYISGILDNIKKSLFTDSDFITVRSTDFTTNSRDLLVDLLAAAIGNGLDIKLDCQVEEVRESPDICKVITNDEVIQSRQVVICAGGNLDQFFQLKINDTYAPLAVVEGLSRTSHSFVELDYNERNCVNLLIKEPGIGLAGGTSLKRKEDCADYLDYVMRRLRKVEPDINIIGSYIGVKSEVTLPDENRNYLFHILAPRLRVWAAIPGKFTLGFSLAPEFYRRVYKCNPVKYFTPDSNRNIASDMIAPIRWHSISHPEKKENHVQIVA